MKLKSGIYLIKNNINGKIYIGSAINTDKRFYEHRWALNRKCHCNIHLQRAWDRYGECSFSFETYLICDKKELIFYEQLVIDAFSTRYGFTNLFNLSPTAGSTLGRKHSEETKIKIGIKSKDRWTGKKHTKETREKMSKSAMGKNNQFFGKHHSQEARKKMSKYHKGRKFSEEHKRKLGKSIKKYWFKRS